MIIDRAPILLGGGFLNDIGSGFMDAARGVVGLATKIRGDQPNQVVTAPSQANYMNYAVYAAVALAGVYIVTRKTR